MEENLPGGKSLGERWGQAQAVWGLAPSFPQTKGSKTLGQENKRLGGFNPRGIYVSEEKLGGKTTRRKKFGGKMGPSQVWLIIDTQNLEK